MDIPAMWDLFIVGILRGGLYALMAVGLSLVFGVMNIPHFAHGEFYMLGAYAAYFAYAHFGLDPLLAILAGALSGLVAGALAEKSIFYPLRKKTKEAWVMNTFLLTVGLSYALQNAAQAIWGVKFRGITQYWEGSIQVISRVGISIDRAVSFLIAMVVILAFWLFLGRTRTGRAIRAAAQDETGAMLVGIDLDRIQTLTFALSSMLAGIAGAALLSVNPSYPFMGSRPLYRAWYVVILVGLGNVAAAIPGGFIVGMLETASYYFLGAGWQDVASLSILILILLLKPAGLFGSEVKGIWER
jgi:branched-chain amino acid transport system permease protein